MRRFRATGNDWPALADRVAIQLNDTHPTLAVPELMGLLLDEAKLSLEKWPVAWFEGLLPRHLEIIHEINRRLLHEVRTRYPGDEGRVARISLIEEGAVPQVRMAHLAIVLNIAASGRFSSDRTIGEYAKEIWEAKPCFVE